LVQTLCETSSARFLGQSFLLNLVERHCKKRLSDGKWRLAGYTEENPKISTACGHHFHLACIYGWMEYSKHCPMCDKVMSVLISAHTVFLLPCSLLVAQVCISLDLLQICWMSFTGKQNFSKCCKELGACYRLELHNFSTVCRDVLTRLRKCKS
jgi:hypothetical protein